MRDQDRTGWELAGLTDDQSRLERSVASSSWWVPDEKDMRLEGARLMWTGPAFDGRKVEPGDGMLEDFLTLASDGASDEQILAYARRWGPLQLCSHGLPEGHPTYMADGLCMAKDLYVGHNTLHRNWDLLADWRKYARGAKDIVNRAARIHRGEPTVEDQISGFPAEQSLYMLLELGWLGMSPVTLTLEFGTHERIDGGIEWRSEPPHLAHRTKGLFGALGAQLLAVAAGGQSIYFCASCQIAFSAGGPGRRRRAITSKRPRTFCDKCGRTAAVRLAGERRRLKARRSQ